jgi:hypothetical protein
MGAVVLVLAASVREWYLILNGRKAPVLQEAPYTQTSYPAVG